MLNEVCRLAELGYRLFPCRSGDKTPATAHGCLDATCDEGSLIATWERNPRLNVGLSTDGLLVLDVDPVDDGANPWLTPDIACELEQQSGAVARTPRGGFHYYFRQPAGIELRNTASDIAPGIDTRASGGYVCVSPSATGNGSYTWVPGCELNRPPEDLPEPPPWILRALAKPAPKPKPTATDQPATYGNGSEPIPNGQRNATLASIGGYLRRGGLDQRAIAAALQEVNNNRCKPQMDFHEVEKIAESVSRYENDQVATIVAEGISTAASSIHFVRVSDVQEEPLKPLWEHRIYKGKLNLLCGDPAKGKSMLTADIAARFSSGTDWPDGSPTTGPGSVIFFSAEDDVADTIKPRLREAGADLSRVYCMESVTIFNPKTAKLERASFAMGEHVPMLEAKLKELGDVGCIVIDPISSYGGKVDSHKNGDVRTMLQPLTDLAAKYEIAILAVTHLSKGSGGKAVYRATGSLAYAAASRAVWMLAEDFDDKTRRLLLPVKINISKAVPGLAFSIQGGMDQTPFIRWEASPVEMTADEFLHGEANRQDGKGDDESVLAKAVTFLQEQLKDGPQLSKDLDDARKAHDITVPTIKRARESLHCRAIKDGKQWWTALPGQKIPEKSLAE